jgi:2-dehydropantoate 2-reductase
MQRICVAGLGAVGATIAARLSAAGHTVNLLARGARLTDLQREGLRVDFSDHRFTARLNVSDRPEFGVQDIVFVAVKAQRLPDLLPTLGPLLGPHTLVAPLVNGIPWWYFQSAGGAFDGESVLAVDPTGALHRSIPPDRLVGCVVYMTSQLLPSGIVSAMGAQRIAVGEIGNGRTDRVEAFAALLSGAGITAQATTNIRDELWTKVALNLATNLLSVVTESTLAEQFTDPKLLRMVVAVLREASRVAAAHGATLTMTEEQMLATGRRAGPFETSMLQDYRAGRELELDAIGHSVLELARKIGQDMPTSALMVDLCAFRAARRVTPAA